MRRLIILRPEPGANASLTAARALGLEGLSVPMFAIEPLAWDPPDPAGFDGLLLTSANAVRHAGEGLGRLRGLKAFAVGEATASAAREAGLDVAAAGDSGVDRLLGSIEPDTRLLHLCGLEFRKPQSPRQQITHIPVYRAATVPGIDPAPLAGAVVAVHSPRAGARLAELFDGAIADRSSTAIAAISGEAAQAAGDGWGEVAVAPSPTDRDLLAVAARLCEKANRR